MAARSDPAVEPFDFSEAHAFLMCRELPQARRDADRLGDMIGTLTEALCLAIAVGTVNAPNGPGELIEGVAQRLFEGVAERAEAAKLLQGAR